MTSRSKWTLIIIALAIAALLAYGAQTMDDNGNVAKDVGTTNMPQGTGKSDQKKNTTPSQKPNDAIDNPAVQ